MVILITGVLWFTGKSFSPLLKTVPPAHQLECAHLGEWGTLLQVAVIAIFSSVGTWPTHTAST